MDITYYNCEYLLKKRQQILKMPFQLFIYIFIFFIFIVFSSYKLYKDESFAGILKFASITNSAIPFLMICLLI